MGRRQEQQLSTWPGQVVASRRSSSSRRTQSGAKAKQPAMEPQGGNLGNIHSGGKQTRSNKNYNNRTGTTATTTNIITLLDAAICGQLLQRRGAS